jgi:hypothetical protein
MQKSVFKILIPLILIFTLLFTGCGKSQEKTRDETATDLGVETQELYSDNGIVIALAGVSSGDSGYIFDYSIENTGDKDMTVSCDSFGVNGLYVPTSGLFEKVPAGKTSDSVSITVDSNILSAAGIGDVGTIEQVFTILSSGYSVIDVTGPITANINAASGDTGYGVAASDNVLLDDGSVKITCLESSVSESGDLTACFFVENDSDLGFAFDSSFKNAVLDGSAAQDLTCKWSTPTIPAGQSGLIIFEYQGFADSGFKTLDFDSSLKYKGSTDSSDMTLHFVISGDTLSVTADDPS